MSVWGSSRYFRFLPKSKCMHAVQIWNNKLTDAYVCGCKDNLYLTQQRVFTGLTRQNSIYLLLIWGQHCVQPPSLLQHSFLLSITTAGSIYNSSPRLLMIVFWPQTQTWESNPLFSSRVWWLQTSRCRYESVDICKLNFQVAGNDYSRLKKVTHIECLTWIIFII